MWRMLPACEAKWRMLPACGFKRRGLPTCEAKWRMLPAYGFKWRGLPACDAKWRVLPARLQVAWASSLRSGICKAAAHTIGISKVLKIIRG